MNYDKKYVFSFVCSTKDGLPCIQYKERGRGSRTITCWLQFAAPGTQAWMYSADNMLMHYSCSWAQEVNADLRTYLADVVWPRHILEVYNTWVTDEHGRVESKRETGFVFQR